jgi:hypothetical protein
MKPLNFAEHIASVKEERNLLNIGRGSISFINLGGDDPRSNRPACLFVSSNLKAVDNHHIEVIIT